MPPRKKAEPKEITRYEHLDARDPRTPETGHTDLLVEEQVVTVPMDNGWTKAIEAGHLEGDKTVVVDMDPAVDPILLWSGKRNRREVPVLPLQRNEIVSESRLKQIIERARRHAAKNNVRQGSLFAELERELRESERDKRIEFYTHDEQWRNKLICGDSLQVMESMLKYEGLAGAVQMIYIDPPYGIAYGSNFQQRVDSTKNEKNDEADDVLAIKAFRDTWTLGVHSYLSYLVERLYVCRELLTPSGSVFVQIGEENVHRVRAALDEVFGADNFVAQIAFNTTAGQSSRLLPSVCDYLLWYARDRSVVHFRQLYTTKDIGGAGTSKYTSAELRDGTRVPLSRVRDGNGNLPPGVKIFRKDNLTSQGYREGTTVEYKYDGIKYHPGAESHWKFTVAGLDALAQMGRLIKEGKSLAYVRYLDDFPAFALGNMWTDIGGVQSRSDPKVYAVQTGLKAILRCVAMTTEPGDLVFDPTCGAGTTAVVAERLGRRWVTCDTSRVAINVARRRLLSSTFDHFRLLNGSPSSGFEHLTVDRITPRSLAYGLEPERVPLVDQPLPDKQAIRVCGPFEVMSLGRYSLQDWKGHLVDGGASEPSALENYVEVMCRLYRPHAEVGGGTGFLHAIAESDDEKIGISVGPLTGRVTAKQILDAAHETRQHGLPEVHVLGWAFEANVGEQIDEIKRVGKVRVELQMIRPDALAEGLKVTQSEMLFSPLALPEVRTSKAKGGEVSVTLEGVGVFDRKTRTTGWHSASDGYIAAWYLDEDYDGDCFVDCQMFFDFRKAPNLKSAAGVDVDAEEFDLVFSSEPFKPGEYRRVAVKVVDVYGNESTVVRTL